MQFYTKEFADILNISYYPSVIEPINVFFDDRKSSTPFGLSKQQDLEALFEGTNKALVDTYLCTTNHTGIFSQWL